jgi:hypothetical protein
MARNVKSGDGKAVVVSVSITPRMKEYLLQNNVSPSKLFAEFFYKFIEEKEKIEPTNSSAVTREQEIKKVLDYFRKIFAESLTPQGDYMEKQKHRDLICESILRKFPELSKANLWDYAERGTFFTFAGVKKDESKQTSEEETL